MALAHTGRVQIAIKNIAKPKPAKPAPLTVLCNTPMRVLAADTLRALKPRLSRNK
jgi:hypothetical protein